MELTCGMIRYMLEAYRNGDLTEEQQAAVLHHLMHCPECMFLLTLVPVLAEN
jgi:predicted anti-sigma-YlaC factor YlaD